MDRFRPSSKLFWNRLTLITPIEMFAASKRLRCQLLSNHNFGILLNFLSAGAFYFATYFLKIGTQLVPVESSLYAFSRYLLGAIFTGLWVFGFGSFKVKKSARKFVFLRAICNIIAVLAFYKAVQIGNAGIANVLNMTYPVFVVLFAGPLLGEWPHAKSILLVLLAFIGILMNLPWLVNTDTVNLPTIMYGILSAVIAGVAVVSLRGAVKSVPIETIMFWMFFAGTISLMPLYSLKLIEIPRMALPYIITSSLLGIFGQWMLAYSYLHLEAALGSIISSSRIIIAILFGMILLDETYTYLALSGSLLIGIANVLLALYSKQQNIGKREDN